MSEPLIRRINREQMCWRAVDVEQLIGEDHLVRAIWDLVGRLHLDGFYQGIDCSEEEGAAGLRSAAADQFVDLRLQPRHGVGAGGGAALRVGTGATVADGV